MRELKRMRDNTSRTHPIVSAYVWGIVPLVLLVVGVHALLGDERDVAQYFLVRDVSSFLTETLAFLTRYGNIPFYLCYAYVLARAVRTRRGRGIDFVVSYLIVLLMLLLVVDIVKIWVGRPRPGMPGEFISFSLSRTYHSFPSSHMTETVLTVLSIMLFYRNRFLSLGCGLWIALMGFTRLYLGRHYPSDLLGGAFLGGIATLAVWRLAVFCPGRGLCRLYLSLKARMAERGKDGSLPKAA